MIPYITYREAVNGVNQYFILQKEHPHFVGTITTMPIANSIVNQPIASYNLWVTFYGTLRGNFIPIESDIYNQIESVLFDMAQWFYRERILKDNKRFKKWKI